MSTLLATADERDLSTIEPSIGVATGRTLVEMLRRQAAATPDLLALTYLLDGEREEQNLTFAELEARVRAVSAKLRELIGSADCASRALLLHPSGLDFVVAFFACLDAGIVAVPVCQPRSAKHVARLESVARDCQPRLLLTSSSVAERTVGLVAASAELRALPVVSTDQVEPEYATRWSARRVDPSSLAFLQYTSGSTGTPKGVMVAHENLAANVRAIDRMNRASLESGRTVIVSWLPHFHDMGMIGAILSVVANGGRTVLLAPTAFLLKPVRWLEAIARFRATGSVAPNFGYDLCVRQVPLEQRRELDLSSWRIAWCGAEAVRTTTVRDFKAAFGPCGYDPAAMFPCYGLAENTLLATCGTPRQEPRVLAVDPNALALGAVVVSNDSEQRQEFVSCGRVQDGGRVSIVDPESGRELPEDRVGEIRLSGPSVARGYWNRPEETERAFGGAWLRTGDLGFLHDGELYVAGRLKDLVIVRGRNVYPQDVEVAVERSVPFASSNGVAVFAVDKDGSESLAIAIEAPKDVVRSLEDEGDAGREARTTMRALVDRVRGAVASEFDAPVQKVLFVRIGSFPRTSSGKVQRSRCRALHLSGELNVVFQ